MEIDLDTDGDNDAGAYSDTITMHDKSWMHVKHNMISNQLTNNENSTLLIHLDVM